MGLSQRVSSWLPINKVSKPLDLTSEESIGSLLSHIDNSMQYGEDEEPKEPKDMDMGDFEQD